ncbi:uncharacterized protein LOC129231557 [Uloborus diversus]|uniref:uncharacterized protein LOC129231557 n=1 Tax=Uloborus diversus TaxID=327109 RepID=UPI00240A5F77|nr:uncharacterized protein LOC129231557 [Uloborus diversus]
MANLRRHFHFSAKSSQEPFSFPHFSKISQNHFDKHSFMNDICTCLDLCCSYIQALNSLCVAGSNLARNLYHTVQAVPAYHTISQQFLSIWEDISKVTASASAAVKTETLMMLQEILNSLEVSSDETDMDHTVSESFQVIGTCLYSFIELQAQFSWSTWKSLSKLTKHCSNDSLRQSSQWRSMDRHSSKMFMNNHLNSNIKKHFSQLFGKVGLSKMSESAETNQIHFNSSASSQSPEDAAAYSPFRSEDISDDKDANCVWSTSSALWATSDQSSDQFGSSESTEKIHSQATPMPSDLDEVINLLSCTPSQQSSSNLNHENRNYIPYSSNSTPMYHLLRDSVGLTHSRALGPHVSWAKENKDINFGHDSWIWRTDNMNCSGLPSTSEPLKLLNGNKDYHWENKELQRWNSYMYETGSSSDDGSSAHGQDAEALSYGNNFFAQHLLSQLSHKRHNSGESMPGGLENVSEVKKENFMGTCSKISTWPLKQSAFKHTENQSLESEESSKLSNFQFPSSYA